MRLFALLKNRVGHISAEGCRRMLTSLMYVEQASPGVHHFTPCAACHSRGPIGAGQKGAACLLQCDAAPHS